MPNMSRGPKKELKTTVVPKDVLSKRLKKTLFEGFLNLLQYILATFKHCKISIHCMLPMILDLLFSCKIYVKMYHYVHVYVLFD